MPTPDRLHPIKLFRQHAAHQKMRPSERTQREPIFRPRLHGLVQPLRPANDEAGATPGFIPACQQRGQAFRIGHGAAKVQGNGHCGGRDGAQDGSAFAAADFGFTAARFGDFDQFGRRAQTRCVMRVKCCFRPGLYTPDGDDPIRARRRNSPSSTGFPDPTCVPGDRALAHRAGTGGSLDHPHQSAPSRPRPEWHRA